MSAERDLRIEAWRPLAVGEVARVRARCAGAWAGSVVRVVERHDDLISGMGRYTVEAIRYPFGATVDAPMGGADGADQHEGSRFDVIRAELSKPTAHERSIARTYLRRLDTAADLAERISDRRMDAADWIRAVTSPREVVHGR